MQRIQRWYPVNDFRNMQYALDRMQPRFAPDAAPTMNGASDPAMNGASDPAMNERSLRPDDERSLRPDDERSLRTDLVRAPGHYHQR